jgi:hypothetical protein
MRKNPAHVTKRMITGGAYRFSVSIRDLPGVLLVIVNFLAKNDMFGMEKKVE